MYGKCCLHLFLLSLFTLSYGDVPKCDLKINLIDDYDSSKIEGIWYAMAFGNEEKSKKRCMFGNITKEKGALDNSILLKEVGLVNGELNQLDVSLAQIGSTSEYLAQSAEYSTCPVSVVGTDYTSFLTWFLCRNSRQQDGVMIATTRERTPSEETMKKVYESFQNIGLDTSEGHLFPIDHSSC